MKAQRVRMILEFDVPVGREHYGPRVTEAPWRRLAEHDMKQWIRDSEDVPEVYRYCAHIHSDVSFEWLQEFEKEDRIRGRRLSWL
ncbi:MAG: hypothetical protein HY680_09940 [Chloroflexi bacterium]|nr:hypothetical protein [Chloroflexota bacterium]